MSLPDPRIIEFAGCPTVVVKGKDLPRDELVRFMDESFTALGEAIRDGLFAPVGPGFSRYDTPLTTTVTLEVGFPVAEEWGRFAKVGDVTVQGSELPAGTTAVARYKGDFAEIPGAWHELLERLAQRGYSSRRPHWEYYDVPPTPGREPEDYITRLCVPVAR